jgi:hypothetical protein
MHPPNPNQSPLPPPLLSHHTLLPRHPLSPPLHFVGFPLNTPLFRNQRRPDLFQLRDLLFRSGFADFLHHLGFVSVSLCWRDAARMGNRRLRAKRRRERKGRADKVMEHTCSISRLVFKLAPYQAPVTVTAAMAPVQTMRRIFCCDIVHVPSMHVL